MVEEGDERGLGEPSDGVCSWKYSCKSVRNLDVEVVDLDQGEREPEDQ